MNELQAIWESFGTSALIVSAATLLWMKVARLEEKTLEQATDSASIWEEINEIKKYLLNAATGTRRH